MTDNPQTTTELDVIYGAANLFPSDDAQLAEVLDGKDIPHWSWLWHRIAQLQRKNIVRVEVHSKWMARVTRVQP